MNSSSRFYNVDKDVTLGGNNPSDYIVSSQKALKTYIDNHSGSEVPQSIYDRLSALETVSGSLIEDEETLQDEVTALETVSGSLLNRVSAIEVVTGSLNGRVTALETISGSLLNRVNALETASGSAQSRLTALETTSGSILTRLSGIETKTGSLESDISDLQEDLSDLVDVVAGFHVLVTMSGSVNQYDETMIIITNASHTGVQVADLIAEGKVVVLKMTINGDDLYLTYLDGGDNSFQCFYDGTEYTVRWASVAEMWLGYRNLMGDRLNALETATGSLGNRVDSLEVTTGSLNGRVAALETASGSAKNRLTALETTSGSLLNRVNSLEVTSGSLKSRVNSLEVATGSLNGRVAALEVTSGSLLTSASVAANNIKDIQTFIAYPHKLYTSSASLSGHTSADSALNLATRLPQASSIEVGDILLVFTRAFTANSLYLDFNGMADLYSTNEYLREINVYINNTSNSSRNLYLVNVPNHSDTVTLSLTSRAVTELKILGTTNPGDPRTIIQCAGKFRIL